MSKLYLILSIHNHQPVGNFDYVLEDAYEKAYLPFLEGLLLHPKLKVVLHYSGNLLRWIEKRHPEAMDMIQSLVNDKRAELLSGGFYEPVLSSLPENDKIMQVKEMTAYIKSRFGYSCKGMWLAERVWEPHMPEFISRAGIEYLSVDDYHFKIVGLDNQDLLGYYMTEEGGHSVKVFPGSETLRYLMPFKDVGETIAYFKEVYMAGGFPLLTMADDGEKFGVWPDTHKHCYEEGWLESFFSALEKNSGWIETTTFDEYQKRFYPAGRVYLPTASYREMGEWALPAESALDYEHAANEMQKLFGDRARGFLRGGIWRFFFAKYPESNHIHKRMLQISRKVHEAVQKSKGKKSEKTVNYELRAMSMLHELWKGQCNDAYWHGIFGGLYLPHLRSSLYRHLLAAESMAEEILAGDSVKKKEDFFIEKGDMDCDGFEEVCICRKDVAAVFTEKGGSLVELSIKKKQVNVLDTLTRRPEAYHSKISEAAHGCSGETKTIHDRLLVKEAGLSDYLIYDKCRRASLIDHFLDNGVTLEGLMRSEYDEKGDFVENPYNIEMLAGKGAAGVRLSRDGFVSGSGMRINKSVLFRKGGMKIDYLLEGKYNGIFAIEFNCSFLGSPYASVHAGNKSFFIKDKGVHGSINEFSIKDEFLKLKMEFSFGEETALWHYPVETISLSEQGVERIYQGTAFLFIKKLNFSDNRKIEFSVKWG